MNDHPIGSIVRCRDREWVVMPSENDDVLLLRPLGGGESELTGIYLPLGVEKPEQASFPPPDPSKAGDFVSAKLLRDAARLSFRSGAGPFRSMGRISVRPRPYQLVPLLMALRQDIIRLLIADDVGVGKTIEALMIARELYDRGEVRRIGVVCPPHLCDQWQREMQEKFNIDAVIIRNGTISKLEREKTRKDQNVFEYYPFFVTSIDYVKSLTRRDTFVLSAPEFIIVDEAHTCARPPGRNKNQQQRHELVSLLAENKERNLLLLTATPHSGIDESFQSLISLLKKEFSKYDLYDLSPEERANLAKYFVQRKRIDVMKWADEETKFPKREPNEVGYELSKEYKQLFLEVYDYASEMVKAGESFTGFRRRIHYWAALSLLRSIMSSPDAGVTSLNLKIARMDGEMEPEEDSVYAQQVYDSIDDDVIDDVEPTGAISRSNELLSDKARKKLREFARQAENLKGEGDNKIAEASSQVEELLNRGYNPIIYCRYIKTAYYVADYLSRHLDKKFKNLRITAVTGELAEDERDERVYQFEEYDRRVLVATDCMSEGINLQKLFNAIIHYDLPWNPNKLEQREGRVDRYGQQTDTIPTVLLYGKDNPIDGALLEVLIRKAITIHKTLGISVPVPMSSETVVEAVVNSLFHKRSVSPQLQLDLEAPYSIEAFHKDWDRNAEREKESRTRFAQHAIKPDEVAAELKETDEVLGDPKAVETFVIEACQRLNASVQQLRNGWKFDPTQLPDPVRERIPFKKMTKISFQSPTPESYEYIGRNHPLTAALSEYLLETSLDDSLPAHHASRSGVIKTDAVDVRTILILLRLRHLIQSKKQKTTILAEEIVTAGFSGELSKENELPSDNIKQLLEDAGPKANITPDERVSELKNVISGLKNLDSVYSKIANDRAEKLKRSHERLRNITGGGKPNVTPQLPPDNLGVYVLLPKDG
jgi:superfamily II DNA or RNA helicase